MIVQFLLNPDGSVPPDVDVELLHARGVPLVVPTPRWAPQPGYELREADPAQDADGTWRQVWVEVPAPPPPVPAPPTVDQVLDDQVHAYEWADGNSQNENRAYQTVSLDETGRIVPATDAASVIGVVVETQPGASAAVALFGKRIVARGSPKPPAWVFVRAAGDDTDEYFVK
jgi:hypothetical protein